MSRILEGFKNIPNAIKNYEQNLPTTDTTPDFPGKGLLTALVDRSGEAIKQRQATEQSIKQSMVAPLLQHYWTGNLTEDERNAVSDQIRKIVGGGKHTKEMLDRMFEVGGQIHGTMKVLSPPPGAAQNTAAQAVSSAQQDKAAGDTSQETGGGMDFAAPAPDTSGAAPTLAPPPTPESAATPPTFEGPPAPLAPPPTAQATPTPTPAPGAQAS